MVVELLVEEWYARLELFLFLLYPRKYDDVFLRCLVREYFGDFLFYLRFDILTLVISLEFMFSSVMLKTGVI